MSAEEPDLQRLRAFLEKPTPFMRHIYRMRSAPFHAASRGKDLAKPPEDEELAGLEKFETQRSLQVAHWIVGIGVVALVLAVALWVGANLPVLAFVLAGRVTGVTRTAAWGVMAAAALLAEGIIFTLIAERRRCVPDPLFARLLREKLHDPEPVPNRLIRALFRDARFPSIFQRAIDATFPRFRAVGYGWESNADEVGVPKEHLPLQTEAVARREDWNNFLDRLLAALPEDHTFMSFFAAHEQRIENGIGLEELYDSGGLGPVLRYVSRGLLFRTLLDDPDTLFVLSDCMRLWRRASLWLSTFDYKQLKDLWPAKGGSGQSGRVADARQVAYLGGLLALLFLILRGIGFNFDFRRETPPRPTCTVDCSAGLSRLTDRIDELIATIRNAPPPPPITVSAAPVTINPPAAPAAAATPIINQISGGGDTKPITVTLPAKVDLAVDVTEKKVEPPPDPNKPPPGTPLGTPPPAGPVTVTGGDYFVTFSKGNAADGRVRTETAEGKNCFYSARLDPDSPFPPRPVRVILSADKSNPEECVPKKLPQDIVCKAATGAGDQSACYYLFAGTPPMYSELLHAYASAAELHRGFWIFTRDRRVAVRVHVQAPPINWETISGPN